MYTIARDNEDKRVANMQEKMDEKDTEVLELKQDNKDMKQDLKDDLKALKGEDKAEKNKSSPIESAPVEFSPSVRNKYGGLKE